VGTETIRLPPGNGCKPSRMKNHANRRSVPGERLGAGLAEEGRELCGQPSRRQSAGSGRPRRAVFMVTPGPSQRRRVGEQFPEANSAKMPCVMSCNNGRRTITRALLNGCKPARRRFTQQGHRSLGGCGQLSGSRRGQPRGLPPSMPSKASIALITLPETGSATMKPRRGNGFFPPPHA